MYIQITAKSSRLILNDDLSLPEIWLIIYSSLFE